MTGTTPRGSAGEREASAWVRAMFGRIAPRYDLANHLLSFNLDRHWRAVTVGRVREILKRPGSRVLDVCCGTGDLLAALSAEAAGHVFGSDFCGPMLTAASVKLAKRHMPSRLFEADALQLPVASQSLDLITVAFGFRNLANYERGLVEMFRVLRPGGVAAILEFGEPRGKLFGGLYRFYFRYVLPRLGGLISGNSSAYTYLPSSVSKFPSPEALKAMFERVGYGGVKFVRWTGGIVTLHTGTKF
jgi:demethylmenaquinone methyltransferase / 2-methoxy-6-polyprenyl-1,4-benzoquinol methylase